MSNLKAKIEHKTVFDFLKKNFAADVNSLQNIQGGEKSQAFSFSYRNCEFVIRVHHEIYGFEKDAYAYEHFRSPHVPIPKTFLRGKLNDALFFSITKKVQGKILDEFTKDEIRQLLPALMETLDTIRDFNIKDTDNFGDWDSQGKAAKQAGEIISCMISMFSNIKELYWRGESSKKFLTH